MKRDKIIISNCQVIAVTDNVRMSIPEIAELFGVFYQTAKKTIRAIEKSGIAKGDDSMNCSLEGQHLYPDYYGLDMIFAITFQLQSSNADVFRKWVIKKAIKNDITRIFVLPLQNALLN